MGTLPVESPPAFEIAMPSVPKPRSRRLLIVAGLLVAFAVLGCAIDWLHGLPADAEATYVGRQTCAACHQTEVDHWAGSHHDRAMELATTETVLGDFNDVEFTRFGVTSRFFTRDGDYYVHTEGPDGQLRDYRIKYTFGIEPLQQYMVEFADGRVQVLRISWDTIRDKWFYVTPADVTDERIEPGDPLHWTGIAQNWNTMCAECHSTNLQKNFDLVSNTYHTTFSEINVSCETCHGPASLHVEMAESRSLFWDRHLGYGLAKLKGGSATRQIETCAPCHSRRTPIHEDFRPGHEFLDHYNPALVSTGLYHADGQIFDEVYVYGSFLQSKMYSEGIRCTDCHDPHSLKLKYEGNRLCAQCHQPGKYDVLSHHHHTDPAGTQCVNCHMPSRTYMVIDDRRDHSLRVPRPDLSVALGTPNACNACHTESEEDAAWAAEAVRKWYGDKRPDDPHYAPAIAAARQSDPNGFDLLSEVLKRKQSPDIIRATAVELLANYPGGQSDTLCRQLLTDSSPLVRSAALGALSSQALQDSIQRVSTMLHDSVRHVRFAAAQRLVGAAAALMDPQFRHLLDKAIVEFREAQSLISDRAGSHINLSVLSAQLGETAVARESLETAMRLEPYLSGVRSELARLMEAEGADPNQVRRLREAEIELLTRDAHLLPGQSEPFYRRGMLQYLLGEIKEARESFDEACRLSPNSYANWLALTLICEQQRDWDRALESLGRMYKLRPDDPAIRGILQRIRQAGGLPERESPDPNDKSQESKKDSDFGP